MSCASTCGLRNPSDQSMGPGNYVLGAMCRKRVCTWKLKTVEGEGGHRQSCVCVYILGYLPRSKNHPICSRPPAQEHDQKSLRSRPCRDLPQSMQRQRRARPRFHHAGHVRGYGKQRSARISRQIGQGPDLLEYSACFSGGRFTATLWLYARS